MQMTRANLTCRGYPTHRPIVARSIQAYGTGEQKQRWLPKIVTGELGGAFAMTAPSGGSDVQTQHIEAVSLLVVETGKARRFSGDVRLGKTGQHAADTSVLFFDNIVLSPETIRVGSDCAQLHGGYGLMQDNAVAEDAGTEDLWRDQRNHERTDRESAVKASASFLEPKERLRREYFSQEEDKGALPPLGACHPDGSDFSLGGHRLSSLYRKSDQTRSELTDRYPLRTAAASSWYKYSNPTAIKSTVLRGSNT